jgi:DNA repair protein RadC
MCRGTPDEAMVNVREIVARAVEIGSVFLVLVHNHPSGDPTPSQADIDMTGQIDLACQAIGVALHDHVVVGRGAEVSFRASGLL